MKHLFRLSLLIVFFLFFNNAFAQKGEVKGVLMDAKHKEPLGYATIAVYTAQDTTLVTFRVSDEKGVFKVPNLAFDKTLRLVITMTGFQVYRKEFTLSNDKPELDLGQIDMEQADHLLQEVLITAEIPPIIVRQDTLEFNANSFKTLPSALVEDLLKKLPGVQVDQDGNITVQGKAVNKILVDGKEFFGNDPKMATQNLPANIIDKVQVVNDPDALKFNPDMPVTEIPQVINLKLKKAIKQGAFGKVYAGGGTQERYEAGGIVNFFRDTTQLSLLAYRNNINRAGFGYNDISRIGGFDRAGVRSVSYYSDGGFAMNGVSFGATGRGIQTSSGGGGNFNTVLKNGIKLNAQYFFGGIDADHRYLANTTQTLPQDEFILQRSEGNEQSTSQTHRIGGRIDWKIDSLTDFSLTPSIVFQADDSRRISFFSSSRTDEGPINKGDNLVSGLGNNTVYGGRLTFGRLFRKKGRRFTFAGNYEYTTSGQDQITNTLSQFFEPNPKTISENQLRENDLEKFTMDNMLSFSEPISKTLSAEARVNIERFTDDNQLNTYDQFGEGQPYDQLNPGLSDFLNRHGWRNSITTGLRWKVKDISIEPGVKFTKLDIENEYGQIAPVTQDFFYVFPSLNVRWKGLYLNYNVNLQEPDPQSLRSVTDNSNPLFVRYGNPNLLPATSHSVGVNYRKFNTQRSLNFYTYLSGSISNNALTVARTIDEDGVQTYRPVNTNGNWRLYGNASLNKDYKFDGNRQFSVDVSSNLNYSKTLILLNDSRSYGQTWNFRPRLGSRINLNDVFEASQSLSFSLQWSRYELDSFKNLNNRTINSETGLVLRLPKKLVWEANLDYRYNSNTAPGMQKSISRLNLGVTYLFMKDDRAQLKLFVFDALDQNVGSSRYIYENYITDSETTILTRYAMLSFTYNIRNFGGKVGSTSNNSFFRF